MEELVNIVLLLVIFSCAISAMMAPITGGKIDPFLFLRPIGRGIRKLVRSFFHSISQTLKGWKRHLWREAGRGRKTFLAKALLYTTAAFLGIAGGITAIPAEVLKRGK